MRSNNFFFFFKEFCQHKLAQPSTNSVKVQTVKIFSSSRVGQSVATIQLCYVVATGREKATIDNFKMNICSCLKHVLHT